MLVLRSHRPQTNSISQSCCFSFLTAVYIKGTVSPEIVQVGQDVILHCQVGGCTSSRLQVHLYKWEGSKNQTLYIHNSTEQQYSVQESVQENNTHKGYYENGFLDVTLLQVQLANGGQYVCSMMCDDVYKEDIVEVTVEGNYKGLDAISLIHDLWRPGLYY